MRATMSVLLPATLYLLSSLQVAGADADADPASKSLRMPACTDSVAGAFDATWIPQRRDSALTGSGFAELTIGWEGRARQTRAIEELRSGNIPGFLRQLKPIHMTHKNRQGRTINGIVWVSPDYVSIGSDDDFLRIPLTRPSAVILTAELGFVLPTRKIVDAIYVQADFRLTPKPMTPGRMMRSSDYYMRHNRTIEEQLQGRPPGELIAGHKKDVVLTSRLLGQEKIAIYGWHKKDAKPVQPLSTVHAARYADYSHGIRLVYATVCVDGQPMSIYDVLEDPDLAGLLSYEGVISRFRKLMLWSREPDAKPSSHPR